MENERNGIEDTDAMPSLSFQPYPRARAHIHCNTAAVSSATIIIINFACRKIPEIPMLPFWDARLDRARVGHATCLLNDL